MFDWHRFWLEYPTGERGEDLLKQVGKTIAGVPISDKQLSLIVDCITETLALRPHDRLLDLCCGNGVITRELAKRCHSVIGVDFSAPLIDTANAQSGSDNVEYICSDVKQLERLSSRWDQGFDKVLCYEALAFLTPSDFDALLANLARLTTSQRIYLFGSVLEQRRIWNFFNTLRRKFTYLVRMRLLRQEVGLGRWWSAREIEQIARKHGLEVQHRAQHPALHTAHYRWDIRLIPAAGIGGPEQSD